MARNLTFKCSQCGERYPIKDEFDDDNRHYGNIDGKVLCLDCDNPSESDSTLIRYNGDKEVIHFDEHNACDEDSGEAPQWFLSIFRGRTWHRTDAWRGYYQTKFKGLVALAVGWVTEHPDDTVRRKQLALDLKDLLDRGEPLGFELYWLFEPTSNVFSTASDILVKATEEDTAIAWLKDNGFTIDDLQWAFR